MRLLPPALFFTLLALSFSVFAGRHTTTVVIQTLPKNHQVVKVANQTYLLQKGVYYTKNKRGYKVVKAPVHATIAQLPYGHTTKLIRGQLYYVHNGTYYRYKPQTKRYQIVVLPG